MRVFGMFVIFADDIVICRAENVVEGKPIEVKVCPGKKWNERNNTTKWNGEVTERVDEEGEGL